MRTYHIIRATFIAFFLLSFGPSHIHAKDFPQGITPSHVYSTMTLLDQNLNITLEAMERKTTQMPQLFDHDIQPMHVYQMAIQSYNTLTSAIQKMGGQKDQKLEVSPKKYYPKDVKAIGDMMLKSLSNASNLFKVKELQEKEQVFEGKTPSDVFQLVCKIWIKISLLDGSRKVTPNHVFKEANKALSDVQEIIKQSNKSALLPEIEKELSLKPKDAFKKTQEVRASFNNLRKKLKLEQVDLPLVPSNYAIRPIDVFIQTQIILAEINLIKSSLGISHPTPMTKMPIRKTPSDVAEVLSKLNILVNEIS